MVVQVHNEIWIWKLLDYSYRHLASLPLTIVIFFCNIFYIFGIDLFTVAVFSLTEPHAPCLLSKLILETDVLQFLQYSYYPYERWWHTTGSGPRTLSLSVRFPSPRVTESCCSRTSPEY